MDSVDVKPLVLLTGPNGFVGAHVLDRLLLEGYRVRGTPEIASQSKKRNMQIDRLISPLSSYQISRPQMPWMLP